MSSFEPDAGAAVPNGFVPAEPLQEGSAFERRAIGGAPAEPEPAPGPAPVADAPPAPDTAELERAAFERGVAAGRAELPWSESEAYAQAATSFVEAARALAALRRDYLARQRRTVVELALTVAEKIVRRELRTDAAALASIVERALAQLDTEGPLRVAVSPADRDALETGAPELAERLAGAGAALEPDPGLERGDVVVDAGASQVDARIPELLRRLREELETALADGDGMESADAANAEGSA